MNVTACPKGHEYAAENTYVNPRTGHRLCRTCQRDHQRSRRRSAGAGLPSAKRTHCPQGHAYDDANTGRKTNGHRYCRACISERERERNQSSERKLQARVAALARYGITIEQYDEMFKAQGGTCATCHRPPDKKALFVDHDHETGRVRGLLCSNCNAALGMVKDDPEVLRALIEYLAMADDGRLKLRIEMPRAAA